MMIQFQRNTFFFSNPINNNNFHSKWLSSSKSSSRSLYCTCCTSSSLRKDQQVEPYVLTTPLYYVNAPPHMGSAYSTIAADSIARFQRLIGKKVIFITGTDEHGEKIATAAAAAGGSSPNDHCDTISQSYRALWKDLDISYDKFIRTTDPKHEAIVEEFYSKVLANGDIYRADYEGLYCVSCEEYKDEKELLENNCCPMHLKPCVSRKEDNYFFALSKYQKRLEEILEQNPDFVQPVYRLNEVQNWMKSGLRDFSISRASVDWGIRVPNDPKQTIYVWFDALLGYISALSQDQEQPSLQTAISSGWPASLHLIGKDILRFHAVYWPAMLMSAGLSLPKTVFGHGFLTKDGMKMGKSLGNTLEPNELVQRFGPDAVRYFFLREVEFGNDGDYSEERFINIVNAHLANTIGNLLNRTLGLLKKNCQSTLVADSSVAAEGNEFKDIVEKLMHDPIASDTLMHCVYGMRGEAHASGTHQLMRATVLFSASCTWDF
nr:methionine--tRNA ligase, chloroplastic/mitochondrial [Tanacetum cinerariifolium]